MALFPNDLRIYISSSPLECKIDSLSIFISNVICLCTTMFGHFSVHQHSEFLASLRSRLFAHRSSLPLRSAAAAASFRRFSKYFHFFVFSLGSPFPPRIQYFFPFYIVPSLVSSFPFLSLGRIGSFLDFHPLAAAASAGPPPPPLHCSPSAHNSLSPQIRSLFTALA